MVVDPAAFSWTDDTWTAPAYSELIIYELHVGTFTPDGTFAARSSGSSISSRLASTRSS
jgi:1,4-alpha-glucan branching enzyme